VRGILDPLIELYRPVPPLAYLPLMVIWFGIGETSKILLIYLAIFAPVPCRRWRGEERPAGADPRGAVAGCQPYAGAAVRDFTGRTAGDFNRAAHRPWRGLVHAGGGRADCRHARIRFMVQSAGEFLATDVVLAGIAVIAAIAFGLELGLRALQRRLTPWHGEIQ
jgi:taurine transport system permease protein